MSLSTVTSPVSIAAILASAINRADANSKICAVLGLTGPGGFALREFDGRLIVWAHKSESLFGHKAIFRSDKPLTVSEWDAVTRLAWIEEYEC